MSTEEKGFLSRFAEDRIALCGGCMILFLLLTALSAPLIASSRPYFVLENGHFSFPLLLSLFTTDSPEILIEKVFNYLLLLFPLALLACFCGRRKKKALFLFIPAAILLALPFFLVPVRMERVDWRSRAQAIRSAGGKVLFAPVPYGPFETCSVPYGKPSKEHLFGVDHAGRDVLSRMLYGARVSIAVGFSATAIAMALGTVLGLLSGYAGGKTDLFIMRGLEIVVCFPTFLLLLILMSIMLDYGSRQSILLVIAVIGFSAWPGLCRLVRGETLKQRNSAYVSAAEGLGVSRTSVLFRHLLPNVSGPVFVSFTFCVAEAILAESSLSFLGFGVQDPAASWGELLRQAFPDPIEYWHLTLWPGFAIFFAVCVFNFTGEGLRKIFDPKS